MKRHLSRIIDICVALFYAALLYYISSQRITSKVLSLDGSDKVLHFFAYTLLGFLVARAVGDFKLRRVFVWSIALSICAAYGFSDELHQYFVPGRTCSVWDWLADFAGGAFGAEILVLVRSRKRQQNLDTSSNSSVS